MKEMFAGIPDEELPPETRERMFCRFHQEKLGVICMNKLKCASCGWNPDVAESRAKIIRERMAVFRYDLQRNPPKERRE